MGILVCGLNGSGKSTLGRALAERLGWTFIDNEDLYFPKADPSYLFAEPRTKTEAVRILEDRIAEDSRFVFTAVKGDYGEKLLTSLQCAVLIEVPKTIRTQRVRERSFEKFGERMRPGGDLYEAEERWFAAVDARPEDTVTGWLEGLDLPVIRIDGTKPVEENLDRLLSLLPQDQ